LQQARLQVAAAGRPVAAEGRRRRLTAAGSKTQQQIRLRQVPRAVPRMAAPQTVAVPQATAVQLASVSDRWLGVIIE